MPFMSAHESHQRPPALTGPLKTRAEARIRYAELAEDIRTITDEIELEGFLMDMKIELFQFQSELPFLWEGDGQDFIGLEGEIAQARQRVARWSVEW